MSLFSSLMSIQSLVSTAAGVKRADLFTHGVTTFSVDSSWGASLSRLNPANNADVKAQLAAYTGAYLTKMKVTFVPGPGAFGRILSLQWAWAPDLDIPVLSLEDLAKFKHIGIKVFGGTKDPDFSPFTLEASFDEALPPTLKSFISSVHPLLYLHLSGVNVGDTQLAGPWLYVRYEYEYSAFGGPI